MTGPAPDPTRLHATAVAICGGGGGGDGTARAVLLLGRSGSGKSDLALRLIDRGAVLIADDQVELGVAGGRVVARPPAAIAGLIEVRGVGLVPMPYRDGVAVALLVDLDGLPERLPEPATRDLLGHAVPLVALDPTPASAALKVERALTAFGLGVEAAAVTAPSPPAEPAAEPAAAEPPGAEPRTLLVTGMSGAGRSSALKALEDMGYEAVDNLPLGLFDKLLARVDETSARAGGGDAGERRRADDAIGEPAPGDDRERPLAIGIDSRTRAFDADAVVARIGDLRGEGVDVGLVFLDCGGAELTRRFSETRRRHPLALDRPAADGIAREREMLAPLRRVADIVIDTTDYAVADLRRALAARFARAGGQALTLTLMSFGFARGLPRDADLVFDMRFLANPHWVPALRPLTGEDAAVGAYIAADPAFAPAFERIADLLLTLLPGYGAEGKAYLTVAFGCTGGRHRSVHVARAMAARLEAAGWVTSTVHRDKAAGQGHDAALPGETGDAAGRGGAEQTP